MITDSRTSRHGAGPEAWAWVCRWLAVGVSAVVIGTISMDDVAGQGRGEPKQGPSAASKASEARSSKDGASPRRSRASRGSSTEDGQAGEEAALAFVRRHYPRLMDVLIYLKENQPRQYARAVKDLHRTRHRLEQIRERLPRRYELELEAWKLQSEIQLLMAELVMSDSPEVRRRLEEAVARQVDLRLELLKADQRQAEARLAKIQKSVRRLEQHREEEVQRLTRQLVAKMERLRGKKRKPSRSRASSASPKHSKGTRPQPSRSKKSNTGRTRS